MRTGTEAPGCLDRRVQGLCGYELAQLRRDGASEQVSAHVTAHRARSMERQHIAHVGPQVLDFACRVAVSEPPSRSCALKLARSTYK